MCKKEDSKISFNESEPIFIVGCGRTGSKLLMNCLNNHPDIAIMGEFKIYTIWKRGIASNLRKFGTLKNDVNLKKAIDFLYQFRLSKKRLNNLKIDKDQLIYRLMQTDRSLRSIVLELMKINANNKEKSILGAKFLVHFYFVPKLYDWFPKAKVIHLIRDPRAVYVSQLKKSDKPNYILDKNNPFYDLGILFYVIVQWSWSAKLHRVYDKIYAKDRYTYLRFEDLVEFPVSELERICDFVGVEYTDSMKKVTNVDSSLGVKNQIGFRKEALEKWRKHIPPKHEKIIAFILSDDMEHLDYK